MKTLRIFHNTLSPSKCFRAYFNVILLLFLIIAIYVIFSSTDNYTSKPKKCVHRVVQKVLPNLPIVKIYGIQKGESILDIVKYTFSQIGYKVDFSNSTDWEVFWSHTYPFYSIRHEFQDLKYNQRINHFPGSGYITQKNNLALLSIDSIPKSFLLPVHKKAFIQYSKDNKNVIWMMKNSNHRGIRILNGTENLEADGIFVQEFVKNPLLINGKKFDIGVYVILTSIDPLRVYMYNEDILLRFCKVNYFPLDINNVESYVVGDDYLPIWDVPDLKFYYSDLNYTAKESMNAYLFSKGKSTRSLWSQISKIIRDVYFSVEENFKRNALSLGSLRNFFELVRFDFIADEYLNVYLLEVNMSPNFSPAHFPQNKLLYEQIVFNSLQIVGLVRKFHGFFFYRGEAEVSEKDIQVNSEQCSSLTCQKSCKSYKCKVCNQCMDQELRDILKSSYLEFMNRGKYRRIIPVPASRTGESGIQNPVDLSEMNALMDTWFKGKCLQDLSWCQ